MGKNTGDIASDIISCNNQCTDCLVKAILINDAAARIDAALQCLAKQNECVAGVTRQGEVEQLRIRLLKARGPKKGGRKRRQPLG